MSVNWKKTLATVAPTIATALGGPLAGVAVKLASDALGVEANEKAIQESIKTSDPNVFLKLKQAENNFLIRLEELGIEKERIAAGDRHSARSLFSVDKRPQIILSAVFIVGYFVVLFALFTGELTLADGYKEVLVLLLGILTREVPTIMQFWFGSSVGSKDKTGMKGAK